jgi:hypothetical protein
VKIPDFIDCNFKVTDFKFFSFQAVPLDVQSVTAMSPARAGAVTILRRK